MTAPVIAVTKREAARLLSCHVRTIDRLRAAGRLVAITGLRRVLIPVTQLQLLTAPPRRPQPVSLSPDDYSLAAARHLCQP